MDFDAHRLDLSLAIGKTFSEPVAFTDGTVSYREIEAISLGAPTALQITGHGLPNGWPFLIENAKPAGFNRPTAYVATLVDANNIKIADLNSRGWEAYTANSGVVVYNTPASLAGRTGTLSARKDRSSTEVLFTLSGSNIVVDDANKRVNLQMSAAETADLADTLKGLTSIVYDLELPDASGVVDLWTWGNIAILEDR